MKTLRIQILDEVSITRADVVEHKVQLDRVRYKLANDKIVYVSFEEHELLLQSADNQLLCLFDYEKKLTKFELHDLVREDLFIAISLLKHKKYSTICEYYYCMMREVLRRLNASDLFKKILFNDLCEVMSYSNNNIDYLHKDFLPSEIDFLSLTSRIKRKLEVISLTIADYLRIDYYFIKKHMSEIE